MKDFQNKFLELALDAEVLAFGDFTLKSGRQSPYFFNAAKMLNGGYLYKLAECYYEAIKDSDISFDCIYGPAYKGIFLGSIVSMILSEHGENYPLAFNRKEVKDHGEGGMFIGQSPSGNVVVVDDVLSAGTAAKESIDLILENDATPSGILVGLNRQEKGTSAQSASFELEQTYNLKVLSVICLDDLIRFLKQSDQAEFIDSMESYRDEWGA